MISRVGGKSRLMWELIKFFPANVNNYYEPFIGGGWSFTAASHLYNGPKYVNDLDPQVYNFFKVGSEKPDTLIKHIRNLYSLDIDRLKTLCIEGSEDPASKAALFYVRSFICFAGIPTSGWLTDKSRFTWGKIESLSEKLKLLKNTEVYNLDYKEFLSKFALQSRDFVYLDPPYHECLDNLYDKNNLFDFVDFSDSIKSLPCQFAVSIGDTTLARDCFKGFYISEFDQYYSSKKKKVLELLITNYPVSKQVRLF